MFKSKINLKSNKSKTGYIWIEINLQAKKNTNQASLNFIYLKLI